MTFLQCFAGKEFVVIQRAIKNKARIFADYCVPGQISLLPFHDCLPVDSRNSLISKPDKSISNFFDMAIE
ncbi:hypothetical protein MD273_02905 [Marinobacter pelagius]|uniref:hypothetical protein n=1 Tax=Marinobacter sp. C7 TaxID=2951363 RepID=UPI001EEF8477|nr:hypothetical protein [Marinobacter sp. C7]MCG7198667.1 hypothetical protein [Marinobacter sp. C7]